MSYNPPYSSDNGGGRYGQPFTGQTYRPAYEASQSYNNSGNVNDTGAYSSSQQQAQYQPRNDRYDTEYDPYSGVARHPTYDQSGYRDNEYDEDPEAHPPQAGAGVGAGVGSGSASASGLDSENKVDKEKNRYDDAFPPALRPPDSPGAIRVWRRDHHGNLWTKGGGGRCFGRWCCCVLFNGVFLAASVLLTLAIFIRPPDVQINNVAFPSTGSAFQVTSDSLNINLGVNISVTNPNYFAVDFKKIKVDLTYPIDNLDVGGGEKDNIDFPAHTQTTFNFPFTLTYVESEDPNRVVLADLLNKCGITGTKSNIDVKYKITLGIRFLFVTVSPSFSDTFSFACPVSANDLSDLLNGSGLTVPGITGGS